MPPIRITRPALVPTLAKPPTLSLLPLQNRRRRRSFRPSRAPLRTNAVRCGVASVALFGLAACDGGGGGTGVLINYPDASVYEQDPMFVGLWLGEVAGVPGELALDSLEPGKYYGSFDADDASVKYVLLLEQTMVEQEGGGRAASNRVLFTWQDGRGGRGSGWLLINREDTAMTGKFGYDRAVDGLGDWSFIRFDEG